MIKILYLEDNKFDIDLTRIELKKTFPDCNLKIVSTVGEANQALKDFTILRFNDYAWRHE